jgi:hypothetical protein
MFIHIAIPFGFLSEENRGLDFFSSQKKKSIITSLPRYPNEDCQVLPLILLIEWFIFSMALANEKPSNLVEMLIKT